MADRISASTAAGAGIWGTMTDRPLLSIITPLDDVRPCPSLNDAMHGCPADSSPIRQLLKSDPASCIPLAGFADHRLCYLGVDVADTDGCSMFCDHVSHVLIVRSLKKVARANTLTNIAAVADKHAIGYRTIGQHPSNDVCRPLLPLESHLSVVSSDRVSLPKPTGADFRAVGWSRAALVNVGPEAGRHRQGRILVGHRSVSFGVAPRGVTSTAGVFACLNFTTTTRRTA